MTLTWVRTPCVIHCGCLTTSRHVAVCRVEYRNRIACGVDAAVHVRACVYACVCERATSTALLQVEAGSVDVHWLCHGYSQHTAAHDGDDTSRPRLPPRSLKADNIKRSASASSPQHSSRNPAESRAAALIDEHVFARRC